VSARTRRLAADVPISEGLKSSSGPANRSFPIQSTCSSSSSDIVVFFTVCPVDSRGSAFGPDRI
jgi:hypothetical protein